MVRESPIKVQMRLKAEREAREAAALRHVRQELGATQAEDAKKAPPPPPPSAPKETPVAPTLTPKQKLMTLPDEDIIAKAKAVGVYEEALGRSTLIHRLLEAGAVG